MSKHRALIVEDDAELAAELADLVTSIEHEATRAMTLEEATAAIADGPYCYALVDIEIPAKAGARPRESSGETVLAKLRALDARQTADGRHVFPIIVVTAHWKDPRFLTRLVELQPTSFVPKPVDAAGLLDRVRMCLSRAGREDHRACGVRPASAKARRGGHTLEIDGVSHAQCTTFRVNGKDVKVQDEQFLFLVRLVLRHFQEEDAYWSYADLGVESRHAMPSRLRRAIDRQVAGAGAMIQTDRGKGFRLDPEVDVEPPDWARFEKHGHPQVERIAKDEARRRRLRAPDGDAGG